MNATELQKHYTDMYNRSTDFPKTMKTSLEIQNLKEGICAGTIGLSGTPDEKGKLLGLARRKAMKPLFEYLTSSTDGDVHIMLVNAAYSLWEANQPPFQKHELAKFCPWLREQGLDTFGSLESYANGGPLEIGLSPEALRVIKLIAGTDSDEELAAPELAAAELAAPELAAELAPQLVVPQLVVPQLAPQLVVSQPFWAAVPQPFWTGNDSDEGILSDCDYNCSDDDLGPTP